MSYTVEQRDALKAAIAAAVQSITFNDRSVQYQPLEDMRSLLAEMERSLAVGTRSYRLSSHDKGV